jgi:hypothetical protein
MPRRARRKSNYYDYDQNDGVSGVVYILKNEGLRAGWIKIGCTRYSGVYRAENLNRNASTGTPGVFYCTFEQRTRDCGRAEKLVFRKLAQYRRGKRGQEFFEVDDEFAKNVIRAECEKISQITPGKSFPVPHFLTTFFHGSWVFLLFLLLAVVIYPSVQDTIKTASDRVLEEAWPEALQVPLSKPVISSTSSDENYIVLEQDFRIRSSR